MYKYSIIVPVYQAENYIASCIDTVLQQTYEKLELILVDNGSVDKSGFICQKYGKLDRRIKNIRLEENVGISNARNIGLEQASGEYVLFMDSDDFYCNKDFLKMVDERLSLSNADVLCYPYVKYYERTGEYQKDKEPYDFQSLCNEDVKQGWKYLLDSEKFDISAWSKVVNRTLLSENNILFEPDLVGEDLNWTFTLMQYAKSIDGIEKCCYAYRIRENSTAAKQRSAKACMDFCGLIRKWAVYMDDNETDAVLVDKVKGYLAYQYYIVLGMYSSIEIGCREKVLEEIEDVSWITEYATGKKAKLCKKMIKFLGLHGTMKILNFYLTHIWKKIN